MEWKPDYVSKVLCSHNLAPRGLWVRDYSRAGGCQKSPGPAELRRELKENTVKLKTPSFGFSAAVLDYRARDIENQRFLY